METHERREWHKVFQENRYPRRGLIPSIFHIFSGAKDRIELSSVKGVNVATTEYVSCQAAAQYSFLTTVAFDGGAALFGGHFCKLAATSFETNDRKRSLPEEFNGIAHFAVRPGRQQLIVANGSELTMYAIDIDLKEPNKLGSVLLRGGVGKFFLSPQGNFLFVNQHSVTRAFFINNRFPTTKIFEMEQSPVHPHIVDVAKALDCETFWGVSENGELVQWNSDGCCFSKIANVLRDGKCRGDRVHSIATCQQHKLLAVLKTGGIELHGIDRGRLTYLKSLPMIPRGSGSYSQLLGIKVRFDPAGQYMFAANSIGGYHGTLFMFRLGPRGVPERGQFIEICIGNSGITDFDLSPSGDCMSVALDCGFGKIIRPEASASEILLF